MCHPFRPTTSTHTHTSSSLRLHASLPTSKHHALLATYDRPRRRRRSAPPDRVPARALARCDGREVGGCGGVRRVVGGMRGGRCGWAASPSCQRARHRDMRLAHADTSAESGSDMSSGAPTHHRHTLRIVVTGSYCAPDRRIMAASASRRAHLRELTSCANMWCVRGRGQQHLRTRW